MLIRHLDQISNTERDVFGQGWRSRRLVVADDGLRYSFHVTTLDEGARLEFEYEDHRETVYCIQGEGQIQDLATGRTERIKPGTIYSAGIGEPHVITADTSMSLVCVFDPPLAGTEEAT
ncbi:MAG TPA: ectoine synthase [Acidimicrobiia bacterium]